MTRQAEEQRIDTVDEDGRHVTVIQWRTMIPNRPISGPSSEIKGNRSWTLLNQTPVTYIDENAFQVFDTEMILKRV